MDKLDEILLLLREKGYSDGLSWCIPGADIWPISGIPLRENVLKVTRIYYRKNIEDNPIEVLLPEFDIKNIPENGQ